MREKKYFQKLNDKEPNILNMNEIKKNILTVAKERLEQTIVDNYVVLTIFAAYFSLYTYSLVSGSMTIKFSLFTELGVVNSNNLNIFTFIMPFALMMSIPISMISFSIGLYLSGSET